MGAAVCTGLGMALSAPDRNVAVITGDGELQMNLGSLNTVATQSPGNLTIVCIDNGTHGETGGQEGHTVNRTSLGLIAQGAGIRSVMEITSADQIQAAHDFIRNEPGPRFLWCRVLPGDPTAYKRNFNPAECRIRFRDAYLGASTRQKKRPGNARPFFCPWLIRRSSSWQSCNRAVPCR